jgi:hypothetical protein
MDPRCLAWRPLLPSPLSPKHPASLLTWYMTGGAGRPGISPRHSAIADYFDDDSGFVVDSHPEPPAWPHDPHLRIRTTWNRIVWPSLAEQLRQSYWTVCSDPQRYHALAARGRERLLRWASPTSVEPRLRSALELVLPSDSCDIPVREPQAA